MRSTEPQSLAEITEDDFLAFEEIRQSGICNMLSPQVQGLAGISKSAHLGIMRHYTELKRKYLPKMTEATP